MAVPGQRQEVARPKARRGGEPLTYCSGGPPRRTRYSASRFQKESELSIEVVAPLPF